MFWLSYSVALLVALAIIFIGLRYATSPRAMAPSFGLPLPEDGANTTWWLRLKGVRDIALGVLVLVLITAGGHRAVGLTLLVLALVPLGDMSTVLAAKGRKAAAFGIHALTAVLMIVAAIPLVIGTA